MTLLDRIRKAQQAQQDNEQRHDVQLSVLPFVDAQPDYIWASEQEVRDHWHREYDADWHEWISRHYDPPKEP